MWLTGAFKGQPVRVALGGSPRVVAWRQGLANALGDVEVGVYEERGELVFWATFAPGGSPRRGVQVRADRDILTRDPTEAELELMAEEFHAAGYPRP